MGISILLTSMFAVHSPLIAAQSPAVQKVVQLLGDRNRATIARIKTLSFAYRTDDLVKPQFNDPTYVVEHQLTGQYYRKGNDFYASGHSSNGRFPDWTITIHRNSKVFWISIRDQSPPVPLRPTVTGVKPDEDPDEYSRPWDRFLIRHPTGRESRYSEPFHLLLAQPHLLLHYRRVVVNDVPLDYVKLSHKVGILECWFDPEWQGWVRKSTFTWHQYPVALTEREILSVARSEDGAIFPTVIDKRYTERGRLMGHARTILSDVRLNGPFEFTGMIGPSLHGAECDDPTTNTRYRIDAVGNHIGPETPIPPKLPAGVPLYPTTPEDIGHETLSKKDIAAFGFLFLTAIAALVWMANNRKRRSTEALRG